jgi:flagellar hook-associated protein 3 FlgL
MRREERTVNIRSTPQALLSDQLNYIRQHTTALATAQQQIASGMRLLHPSDDPTAMVAYLHTQAQDAEATSRHTAVKSVQDRLQQGESAVSNVGDLINQAYQIALQGANSNDPAANDALAQQVDGIITQVLNQANGQADGRYLFGGTDTRQAPFTVTATDASGRPTAVTYQGSAARASAALGPGPPVDLLYTGQEVYQQPGADVFAGLIQLRDQLRNTGGLSDAAQAQALSATAGVLQTAHDGVLHVVGEMSTGSQSLSAMDTQLTQQDTDLKSRLGELGSADLPSAITEAQTRETLLQAALTVSGRIFSQSLLNYLPVTGS